MKGVFWLLAFLGSLVILAAAYYVTSSSIRTAIDPRLPWVATYLRPYIRDSGETASVPPKTKATPEASPAASSAAPAAPVRPVVTEPEVFDLKKLAANREAWPAKVTITKATHFPAVVNGKVVGGVTAPVGTEVGLVTISGGKIGVQYQGGGAWVFVEETDLVARTQKR
jgi:hypothetical protein